MMATIVAPKFPLVQLPKKFKGTSIWFYKWLQHKGVSISSTSEEV